MDFVTLGGNVLGTIPLGDIVLYITPFSLFLFAVLLGFTVLIALSKPETQIEATMHYLHNTEVKVGPKEFKQRRFLSVLCGIASAGAMITGDLFNFTLFMALVGILNIGICDGDIVEYSNFNRQIIATEKNVNKSKVLAMKDRILDINDLVNIKEYDFFIDSETINNLDIENYDLVLDCIDDVKAKILIIEKTKKYNVEIISCMGTANKTDPNSFKIVDINQTSYCPLAKKIRTELKKKNISNVKVCFSTETPINTEIPLASQIFVVASSSFVIVKAAIELLLNK